MNNLIKRLFIGSMLLMSFQSFADSVWCSGKITHTYLNHDGVLYIHGTWRNQHTAICDVDNIRDGVTPETCKGWLSIAMAAKLSQNNVVLHYGDVPSCSAIPQYNSAPKPSYLMLAN